MSLYGDGTFVLMCQQKVVYNLMDYPVFFMVKQNRKRVIISNLKENG